MVNNIKDAMKALHLLSKKDPSIVNKLIDL